MFGRKSENTYTEQQIIANTQRLFDEAKTVRMTEIKTMHESHLMIENGLLKEEKRRLEQDKAELSKSVNECNAEVIRLVKKIHGRSEAGDHALIIRQLECDLDRERNANRVLMRVIEDHLADKQRKQGGQAQAGRGTR